MQKLLKYQQNNFFFSHILDSQNIFYLNNQLWELCTSQKQIRDFEKQIQKKQRILEQTDLDIFKFYQLKEKYTKQGLERQAELTKKKNNKTVCRTEQNHKIFIQPSLTLEIENQLNEPILGRKGICITSENKNLSEEVLELEESVYRKQEKIRKLRAEKNNQNKNKKFRNWKKKMLEK